MPSIQLCNDLHGSNFSSIMIYMVITQFNATQFAISRVILTYSFWQCLKIRIHLNYWNTRFKISETNSKWHLWVSVYVLLYMLTHVLLCAKPENSKSFTRLSSSSIKRDQDPLTSVTSLFISPSFLPFYSITLLSLFRFARPTPMITWKNAYVTVTSSGKNRVFFY